MCNFISWVEYKGEILFLTKHELRTNKGKELTKHLGLQYYNDIKGHGAIEHYYDLKSNSGVHRECEDFSSPDNFPLVIQEAIKRGDFEGIGTAKGLLTDSVYADYKKIVQSTYANHIKIIQSAFWKLFKVRSNRQKVWR